LFNPPAVLTELAAAFPLRGWVGGVCGFPWPHEVACTQQC